MVDVGRLRDPSRDPDGYAAEIAPLVRALEAEAATLQAIGRGHEQPLHAKWADLQRYYGATETPDEPDDERDGDARFSGGLADTGLLPLAAHGDPLSSAEQRRLLAEVLRSNPDARAAMRATATGRLGPEEVEKVLHRIALDAAARRTKSPGPTQSM